MQFYYFMVSFLVRAKKKIVTVSPLFTALTFKYKIGNVSAYILGFTRQLVQLRIRITPLFFA